MLITVERVSKFGVQANGKWHNLSKFSKTPVDLSTLSPGMQVEINAKGYITGLAEGGMTTATEGTTTETRPALTPTRSAYQDKNSPSVRMEIARGTAVKAVLGSPLLFEIYRPARDEQGKVVGDFKPQEVLEEAKVLIEQVTNYIATGSYDKELPVTAASLLRESQEALS